MFGVKKNIGDPNRPYAALGGCSDLIDPDARPA